MHKHLRIVDDFLSPQQCADFIKIFISGHLEDIDNGVACYKRGIVINQGIAEAIYRRALPFVPPEYGVVGANEYIRFSEYRPGGDFKMHRDGINQDRHGNRSVITVNIFLNEDFEGGSTDFYCDDKSTLRTSVAPKTGRCAVFDSQQYHTGCPVLSGTKYLLRTDLMRR